MSRRHRRGHRKYRKDGWDSQYTLANYMFWYFPG